MENELRFDLPGFSFGEAVNIELSANHRKRDELISALLQDRSVLRLISAPHGFGKTELAREYAVRLFSGGDVVWVDGDDPGFLLFLDKGGRDGAFQGSSRPDLMIIDGLPWLHEQRAQALSHYIDLALYAGVEVIVTVLPSCDCLSVLQPEQIALYADDLLVKEHECAPRFISTHDEDGRALSVKRWRDAGTILFGRTPAYLWHVDEPALAECLIGLFGEKLPLSFLRMVVGMMLLGGGTFDDLDKIDIEMRSDDAAMLMRDYPFIEIDHVAREFKVPQFKMDDLKRAIVENRLESVVTEDRIALPERALGFLFARGDTVRSSRIIDVFCSDEHCANWLLERGWTLIDSGKVDLVADLLERCPETVYVENRTIQAMHAWHAGLSGDAREACHIAERVLSAPGSEDGADVAGVAARMALAMFDENSIATQRRVQLSSSAAPVDAVDFLASVMDHCTNVEISRAFKKEGAPEDPRHEQARRSPSRQRARVLHSFFTEHADRFRDSCAFNLALHILSHVDDIRLRKLVQELGCDAVVEMRRSGVTRFSTAILVRDMWQTGYFGLTGPIIDRRDARILDGASHMLTLLSQCCGYGKAFVPWANDSSPLANPSARAMAVNTVDNGFEMYIRLFGGFELTVGDQQISESVMRKKSRALLAFLVLHLGRDVPREEIFEQLWPNSSHVQALDNFYTAWNNCVAVMGEAPFLQRNGDYCRIDPRFVRSDVAEFEQLTRHLLTTSRDSNYLLDTYAKLEVLYQGSLLPSELSVRMINAQRERYRALYVDAMVAASDCALNVGDVRIALWFARKAMEEDQTREDVFRALMRSQIAAGQRCPAIKTYFNCREYLRNTLGLDPSLETRELYNSLVTTDPELLRLDPSSFPNSL